MGVVALSDAAWATIGVLGSALIGGPILVIVKRHDKRDEVVASKLDEVLANQTTHGRQISQIAATQAAQGEQIDSLSKGQERLERRLDAHIDRATDGR